MAKDGSPTSSADQTAIANENTRLKALVAQQQHTITALRQTAHAISSSLDLDEILCAILDQLPRVLPRQEALIFLREDERLRLVAATGSAVADKATQPVLTPTDNPALFDALRQGRTFIAGDGERSINLFH